ncbi:permease [Solwaraspora sp. WMMD791]|uniref:SCO7613 C-terminal domain-containing membrane protein n=1 Tax=Solwaraspora sp. WMMD791 TaxID=3016086 RepID=UPI00249B74F3|nr:permease [Solwaraspora sp. WMMD791]WFE24951.1 permease [Solwaraspora sp. WMMD791]
MSTAYRCTSCGRTVPAAATCSRCGAAQPQFAEDLARIERSIAEMKAREVALAKEQKQMAADLQAAIFQRDILSTGGAAGRRGPAPRISVRRRAGRRPPTAEAGAAPPRFPRQTPHRSGDAGTDGGPPPGSDEPGYPPASADDDPTRVLSADGTRPEASPQSIQNVLLGLGALMAMVVFAAVANSTLPDATRLLILLTGTVLLLVAPPVVAARGLRSTAETIAAVALILVPIDGYALWVTDAVRSGPVSPAVFAGLTFVVTALVAGGYAATTGLQLPRYAMVLAVQPIVPLLCYDLILGPAGWALALAAVAVVDLLLVRLLTGSGRFTSGAWLTGRAGRATADGAAAPASPAGLVAPPQRRSTDPAAPPGGPTAPTDDPATTADGPADPGTAAGSGASRPEGAPEEADAVVGADLPGDAGPDRRAGRRGPGWTPPAPSAAMLWLRDLIWTLHGLAVAVALAYAVAAVLSADTVPAAVRAGAVLVIAAGVGLIGGFTLGYKPVPDIAAGVFTLAVIGAASRIVAVGLPGRALLLIAAVVAIAGIGVRALPETLRRGPQLAATATLGVLGVLVAGSALRAALAPVRAALPAWQTELSDYQQRLDAYAGPADWQLALAALLITVAAAVAVPVEWRREATVTGVTLTALAVPASFDLPWYAACWPPVLAAVVVAGAGLFAGSERSARVHVGCAAVLGAAGAGAALARPGATAAVLLVLAAAGVLIAVAGSLPEIRRRPAADPVAGWAAGGAAFALPGGVAAFVAAMVPAPGPTGPALQQTTAPILAAAFLAVCGALCYAALAQVAERQIPRPLTIGTGLGALAVTAATFGSPGATVADVWVAVALLLGGVLLFMTPSIDANRRADRLLDGTDYAAAAAIAVLVGTLARISAIVAPGIELVASAALALLVAVAIRAMPQHWQRGPVLGVAASGAVIAVLAGYTAVAGGIRALATPGQLWQADLTAWSVETTANAWQVPLALVLLAMAAAVALPRPWSFHAAGVLVALATVGTPAALGLPWWSPIAVGCLVAIGYGIASVAATDPQAATARATVAAAVALYAAGASLVRPWTTAAALGVIVLTCVVVAVLGRVMAADMPPDAADGPDDDADDDTDLELDPAVRQRPTWAADDPATMPRHLATVGGAATGAALLALPGALAAFAATLGWTTEVVLTSALAASALGVAVLAAVRRQVPHYLPYATVGVAGGATVTALASLPTDLPTGMYAAGAALLAVLAELLRAATPPPTELSRLSRRWSGLGERLGRPGPLEIGQEWAISPVKGALAAAALPTALAVAAVAPTLTTALVEPYRTLAAIWQGPPAVLLDPPAAAVGPTNVLAALLLTVAAALAATAFNSGQPGQIVPVVLPGVALTLLITPLSFGIGWPTSTTAALLVFAVAMIGLALTAPPPDTERHRPLRIARRVLFIIGLAAGGAGLAGALANDQLTVFTLGSAVAVGAVAAYGGRSQPARILGWLFASVMAQLFVLTLGLVAGLPPTWSAFGVLAVGAALLLSATRLPRLDHPEAVRERSVVEWSSYAAALLALALAYSSTPHLAGLLAAWGAVLGVTATRPGRRALERRILFWTAVGCEITAWWMLMRIADVALIEAYTLPFAALALLVGVLELRHRPDLSSWTAYGPALVATFLPTLVIVISDGDNSFRHVLLLLGAVGTLLLGAMSQQQAPVVVGTVVSAVTALHALTFFGPWLVLIPVGLVLLALGASSEWRRQTQERVRGALRGMR